MACFIIAREMGLWYTHPNHGTPRGDSR